MGKKLSQMNYGCELLNNGLMPILALPELYKQSPALGRGKDAHLFQDILYYSLEGGIDIFYDVQGLLITFLGRSKIYTPPPVIGFHFKRQAYICSYKWLHRNLHRLYGLLSDSWIDIFHTLDRCIYASFISASHIDRIRGTLSILTLPELMSTDHLYRVSSDGKIMPIISPDDVRISGFQEHSTIIDNPNKNTIGKLYTQYRWYH